MGAMERPWLLRGTVIGLALLVALVAWIATSGEEETPASEDIAPRIVDEAELSSLAAVLGHPVYWAGEMPGRAMEATESADGSVQVRYLDESLEAGEGSAAVLTVGSYPLPDPSGALDSLAGRPGAIVRARDGRRAVTNRQNRNSVYFADPGNTVQVEVYDPSPRRALRLALSGRVRPAG